MRSSIFVISVFAVSLSLPAPASATGGSVPFVLRPDGAVLVPVTVDGAGTALFLVDTGAAGSTIAESLANRLGLTPIARTLVTTPAGREWQVIVELGRLTVGSASVTGLLATTAPRKRLEAVLGQIDGILGEDFLSRFNYTLDYRHRRLDWDSETNRGDGACTRLRLIRIEDRFVVELPQRDAQVVYFVPDSGSDVIVVFERPGRPALPMDSAFRAAELNTVGSRRSVPVKTLRRLDVGTITLRDREAALVKRPEPDAPDCDGLLPLHLFASVSFNTRERYLLVRSR